MACFYCLQQMGNCQSIDFDTIQVPRQGPVTEMNINHCMWSQKYLGLFDYDSKELIKRRIKIEGNGIALKEGSQIIFYDEKTQKLSKKVFDVVKNHLFKLVRSQNFYQLIPIVYQQQMQMVQRPLWLVLKSLPQKTYSIKQRDIIKFGKQKIKVREVVPIDLNSSVVVNNDNIRLSRHIYDQMHMEESKSVEQQAPAQKDLEQKKQQQQNENENLQINQNLQNKTIDDQQNICRICLQPGLTSNPLITPCKCTGTVRYIHLLCIKQWLSKQIKAVINDFSVTINWKPLICQMCKSHYKYRIYLDNQKFYTVDIPKPQKPYIVLQILNKKNKGDGKIFKFITFKNKPVINVGRKKDVDVRISDDISVSRIHAIIKYKDKTKQFLLEDNNSKFGTMVLAKNGILIRPHHQGISIQVGAQLFQFQALRQKSSVRCANYQNGDDFLRQQIDQQSDEEQQGGSQAQDQVLDLPVQYGDNSPVRMNRLQRSSSLQHQPSQI